MNIDKRINADAIIVVHALNGETTQASRVDFVRIIRTYRGGEAAFFRDYKKYLIRRYTLQETLILYSNAVDTFLTTKIK